MFKIISRAVCIIITIMLMAQCANDDSSSGTGSNNNSTGGTITVGTTMNGSIGVYGGSNDKVEYSFTTGSAPSTYTISLTNTTTDLSWDLSTISNDVNWDNTVATCDTVWAPGDKICQTGTLSPDTTYYILIINWDSLVGTYTVAVSSP